ncbi:MAG: response regulator [Alphaproteobacteria bacterium]|nr:response regulator [Alphaproteobacteria bacterium]
MRIADQLQPVLPMLRRYARALSGSQASGDTYVRIMLETLITEPQHWDLGSAPRIAAFKLFHQVWSAVGLDVPAAGLDANGRVQMADERLASLPPRSRQALLLTAMEGFSREETAEVLGMAPEAVSGLLDEAEDDIRALTRAKVLVIEDEPIIALDIAGLVEGLGHSVTSICSTRDEAVSSVESQRPDLVLADIQLADGSSGIDAAVDILSRVQVPIVFVTAFPERLLTGRKVEPTFLITKPFQPNAVRAAISQALFFQQNARTIS